MTTDQHLAHLRRLLAPPFAANWKAYVWARAQEIAQEPEHAELPRLLAEAMRNRATSTSTATS